MKKEKGKKDYPTIIITIIAILSIGFAMMALVTVFHTEKGQAPNLFGVSMMRVVSGSMEPTIADGAVILVKKINPDDLKVGDAISFYAIDPGIAGEINTHRIVEITQDQGRRCFITKGDANGIQDPYGVYDEKIIGKVIFDSKLLGYFISVVASKYGFLFLILLPLLGIVIFNLKDIIRLINQEVEEELKLEEETEERDEEKNER
ncbi:MAG: signal peptidase I [Anaerovorax sp.]